MTAFVANGARRCSLGRNRAATGSWRRTALRRLDQAERRVRVLREKAGGGVDEEPFDDEADEEPDEF